MLCINYLTLMNFLIVKIDLPTIYLEGDREVDIEHIVTYNKTIEVGDKLQKIRINKYKLMKNL